MRLRRILRHDLDIPIIPVTCGAKARGGKTQWVLTLKDMRDIYVRRVMHMSGRRETLRSVM